MKVCLFSTHQFEKKFFNEANVQFNHQITFFDTILSEETAVMANGHDCVCAFVNDRLNENVLKILSKNGVKLIAMRSAGYNNVNLAAAAGLNMKVVRVPEYSPYAVAEHVVALIMSLNRKTHKAYNRIKEGNFSLDGLVGFDLHGKTIGVVGTGKIGKALIHIMKGFGCRILAFDKYPDKSFEKEMDFEYCSLDQLLKESNIVSLHVPLNTETFHLINSETLAKTQKGVMLINTGRGGLIDTRALINSLKSKHLGAAGLDVYEEEENFFFNDLSGEIMNDDVLARLLTFPNVLLTGHQGFLTNEALKNISFTTLSNISDFERGRVLKNEITL